MCRVGGWVGGTHKVMVETCVHLEAPFSPLAFQLVDGLVFIFSSITVRLVGVGGLAACSGENVKSLQASYEGWDGDRMCVGGGGGVKEIVGDVLDCTVHVLAYTHSHSHPVVPLSIYVIEQTCLVSITENHAD